MVAGADGAMNVSIFIVLLPAVVGRLAAADANGQYIPPGRAPAGERPPPHRSAVTRRRHALIPEAACMKHSRLVPALLLVCLAPPALAADTAIIMRRVYDAIAYLLPLSLREPAAETPWDADLIADKTAVLETEAAALVEHAGGEDAEFRLLARSFETLARDTAVAFREGWPDYAYHSLLELTDHCVACHARLPSASQDLFAERLLARMNVAALPPEARAQLQIATRQFDAALTQLEEEMLAPELDPLAADRRGLLLRYLQIAIATSERAALDRVKDFLDRYRARGDLPFHLEHRLAHWRKAATRLTTSIEETPSLRRAGQIFDYAGRLTQVPGSHYAAVEDLVAARLLRTYLQLHPDTAGAERAGIYYRLAVIALRTAEPDPAVPAPEILLVAAIEADPGGPFARDAYASLEEHGRLGGAPLAEARGADQLIDLAALRRRVLEAAPAP
jgi:hypothetical protein